MIDWEIGRGEGVTCFFDNIIMIPVIIARFGCRVRLGLMLRGPGSGEGP